MTTVHEEQLDVVQGATFDFEFRWSLDVDGVVTPRPIGHMTAALQVRKSLKSPVLVEAARERLAAVGAEGVVLAQGLLEEGCREAAPFDAILVNGSINSRPDVLLGQLAEGGRLVAIRGRGRAGSAVLFVRAGEAFGSRSLFDAVAPVLDAFREEPGFVF